MTQVLKRSGTPKQAKDAAAIMPILRNPHLLLVTLLLCNAAAVEASAATRFAHPATGHDRFSKHSLWPTPLRKVPELSAVVCTAGSSHLS